MSNIYSHDNSYLSMEYNNLVPLIDLTVSINTSSRRKYRKRYIDNFNLQKNLHYMREANKLILGIIYRILLSFNILPCLCLDYSRVHASILTFRVSLAVETCCILSITSRIIAPPRCSVVFRVTSRASFSSSM